MVRSLVLGLKNSSKFDIFQTEIFNIYYIPKHSSEINFTLTLYTPYLKTKFDFFIFVRVTIILNIKANTMWNQFLIGVSTSKIWDKSRNFRNDSSEDCLCTGSKNRRCGGGGPKIV